jgi:Do/DeqQ family serine protease
MGIDTPIGGKTIMRLAPLFMAAAALLACDWAAPSFSQAQAAAAQRVAPTDRGQMQLSFSAVAKQASPAVVNVYAQRVVREMAIDPRMAQFGLRMGVPQERVQGSLGSGVLVRADGIIVTNHHVVEKAQAMKVVLSDRREFDATLLLDDAKSDLAVLRIDTKGERLPVLPFADTHNLQVGDLVLAIGNPFGLNQTVTNGIISAVGRTGLSESGSYIQTDAAINEGNSGGALVDMTGSLVGINTMIISPDSGHGSAGIGFAIPAEMAKRVVDSAVSGGKIVRPWLGVKGQAVTGQTAAALRLSPPRGILISNVYPGGPAAKAGLLVGDVLLAVNGAAINDEAGARYQAATANPGTDITLDIVRDSGQRQLKARAEAAPRTPAADMRTLQGRIPLDGTQVANLSPAEAEEVGFDTMATGVYIKAMAQGGVAAQLGLRPGDIIRSVNGQAVNTSSDLEKAMRNPAQRWLIGFERNGQLLQLQV